MSLEKGILIDVTTPSGISEFKRLIPTRQQLCQSEKITPGKDVLFLPNDVIGVNRSIDGRNEYCLHLYGALQGGSKAHLMLRNLDIYFTVFSPTFESDDKTLEKLKIQLCATISCQGKPNQIRKIERVKDKILYNRGLTIKNPKVDGWRVYFYDFYTMLNVCQDCMLLPNLFYVVDNDINRSTYPCAISRRTNIKLGSWLILRNFEYLCNDLEEKYRRGKPLTYDEEIELDILRKNPLFSKAYHNFAMDINNLKNADEVEMIGKDRLLELDWDIETYGGANLNSMDTIPPDLQMFMIGTNLSWSNDKNDLMRICLVDKRIKALPNHINIMCGNNRNICKYWGLLLSRLLPDLIYDFNGGQFDFPVLYANLDQNGQLIDFYKETNTQYVNYEPDESRIIRLNCRGKRTKQGWKFPKNEPIGVKFKFKAEQGCHVNLCNYYVPGMIPVDMRAIYRKRYPKESKSGLNFYLSIINQEPKVDMGYDEMWHYYKTNNLEGLTRVAEYCTFDAQRCKALRLDYDFLNQTRSFASYSNIVMYESIYKAVGLKVHNATYMYGNNRHVLFVEYIPHGKKPPHINYGGGRVFCRRRGRIMRKIFVKWLKMPDGTRKEINAYIEVFEQVAALDYSSLYPSLIRTFNLSKEMITLDPAVAEAARKAGFQVMLIEFVTKSGEKFKGWSILHNGDPKLMGIIPQVLDYLFNERAKLKKIMGNFENLVKHTKNLVLLKRLKDKIGLATIKKHIKDEPFDIKDCAHDLKLLNDSIPDRCKIEFGSMKAKLKWVPRIIGKILKEEASEFINQVTEELVKFVPYQLLKQWFDFYNAAQLAVKVLMNSFYGVTGQNISCIYDLIQAGGTTFYGREYLKLAEDFANSCGHHVYYGDTDSIYMSPNHALYKEFDEKFANGEITAHEHQKLCVEFTIRFMIEFGKKINTYIKSQKNNGLHYLKMAYEETLAPFILTGKKKNYGGIKHIWEFVPYPTLDDEFYRGFDFIKASATPFLSTRSHKLFTTLCTDMTRSPEKIVKDEIDEIAQKKWDLAIFAKKSTYKIAVNNSTLQTFKRRMAERNRIAQLTSNSKEMEMYRVPENLESILTIKTRKPTYIDAMGRKVQTETSIGNCTEYLHVAQELDLEPDIEYYMENIFSQFGCFITYLDEFKNITESKTLGLKTKKYLHDYFKSTHSGNKDATNLQAWKKIVKLRNAELGKQALQFGANGAIVTLALNVSSKITFTEKLLNFYWALANNCKYPPQVRKSIKMHKLLTLRAEQLRNEIEKKKGDIEAFYRWITCYILQLQKCPSLVMNFYPEELEEIQEIRIMFEKWSSMAYLARQY